MPPDSSNVNTERKGIKVLLNCHDFSNVYVHAYIP